MIIIFAFIDNLLTVFEGFGLNNYSMILFSKDGIYYGELPTAFLLMH